jgi:hypothetical protein
VLYDDYTHVYLNTPLLNDALASYDLTNKDNISRLEITDGSGNGNRLKNWGQEISIMTEKHRCYLKAQIITFLEG